MKKNDAAGPDRSPTDTGAPLARGVLVSLPKAAPHAGAEPSSSAQPDTGASSAPAFERLYQDYFSFTWRTLRALGIPKHALDDAAQEVWLIVHRRLQEFEGRSSVKTWLFGISVNVSRNLRRSHLRHRERDELPAHLASDAPGPAEESEGREAWEVVRGYVETLDRERREVFVCSLLEGLSSADTAQATGLDVTTIYHRIRALRRGLVRWGERRKGQP